MWLVIIIVLLVVAYVLYSMGVFRKPGVCKHCGKEIKGVEQVVLGREEKDESFILCKKCASGLIDPVRETAKKLWCYEDYLDFLKWNEETKEERSKFNHQSPETYGGIEFLTIDLENSLFQVGTYGEIFRFQDVGSYHFSFVPTGGMTDEGKYKGDEYVEMLILRPATKVKLKLVSGVEVYPLKLQLPGSENKYSFSPKFALIARLFSACHTMELAKLDNMNPTDPKTFAAAMMIYNLFEGSEVTKSNIEAMDELVMANAGRVEQINEETIKEARALLMEFADNC